MSSRHLIDPELVPALAMFPDLGDIAQALPMMRAGGAMLPRPDPAELPADVEEVHAPTADGREVALVLHRPRGASGPLPALLHIHGGGYVFGTAAMGIASNAARAAAVGCLVASVEYRLAPETAHPGPLDDCYAALGWLHAHAPALGVDPARIGVIGESAGGGLAAALALLARDRGALPPLVHQHLIYPMIDDRTAARDAHAFAGEFVWTHAQNHFGWSALLGHEPGRDGVPPYAAAARADDLAGLPSTYIAVGALDLFAEEDIDYARRLIRAGVPTELHVYPGAFHGFEVFGESRAAKTASANSIAALRRALGTN